MELQPDDTIGDVDRFHVSTVRVEVRADLAKRSLDRDPSRLYIRRVTKSVSVQQLSGNRVRGDGLEQHITPPLPQHLNETADAVGMEDIDPVEQLDNRLRHRRVVMTCQLFGQLGNTRQYLVELKPLRGTVPIRSMTAVPGARLIINTHATSALTRASTSSTVASTASENPRPKVSSSGSTSITTVSSGNSL